MDSPKLFKSPISSFSASAPTSSTSPVQESPFSNYISTLSPIKHDKAPHVAQGFVGLNSPPLVFTSPRISTLGRPQSSNVEVSRNGEGDKTRTDESRVLEGSVTEVREGLVVDVREDGIKDNVSVQPSSSSGCVDDYLADPDCVNSAYTVNSILKQSSSNVLQSSVNGLSDLKSIEFGNKINVGREVDAAQWVSEQNEESIERKLASNDKSLKIENEQGATQGISDEFQKFNSDTFDLSSKEKELKNSGTQKVVEDNGDGGNSFLQQLPYEDFAENVGEDADVPVNSMSYDVEASEVQRGMSRRCLQFGEAQPEARANRGISTNLANRMISSTSLATTSEAQGFGSSHLRLTATSRRNQLVNLSQLAVNLIPRCYGEDSSLTVPKPSGIGLHLNSIVNALPTDQGETASMKLAQATNSSCQSTENIDICSDAFEKVSSPPRDGIREVKVHTSTCSAASESLSAMESIECNMTLNTKRKFTLEDGDSNEPFDQQRPEKKRKKLSNGTDGEGCKRCNCKKTKCLKLYCDCFAAGIYCSGPCSCQGCFNRPEYQDTVLETRKQIESRNPLAFAPKIVQPFTEVPLSNWEDGNRKTPSSGRHKRGCNCKKSMCLKKYCECYQANVGCSIGCRCEGCKNVYGKKEDYCMTEEMVNRSDGERLESRVAAKPHHLTPATPSFQYSDHGKNASTSRLISRRCLPSPDSDLTILSYAKSPKSPRTSDSNDMLLETSKETLDIVSYREGISYNNAVVLADEFHHTPLPNHTSRASTITRSSSSKARELTNLSRFQLDPGSSSLRWHRSPITPMSPLDENKKLQALDSADGGLYDIMEDDMPEILKDTSMAIKSVKTSSPNGKRVSPPHKLHQFGSSSSGPLKSGRKFILKAVPSFPPLTPCIDSNKSSNQSRNDFQEKQEQ